MFDDSDLSYENKKKIINKIQNIKNKKNYINLFKLIIKLNISYSLNKNGIFFNLNKIDNKDLNKIIDLIDSFEIYNYN
jgi:hypothetical protein|tara:strand:+ start:4818 stop:5051 length:234 start_codon:yes stop_codon:yes gene_type:complete